MVGSVIDAVAQAIAEDKDEVEIYTSGATNIFKYPELADTSKAVSYTHLDVYKRQEVRVMRNAHQFLKVTV